MAVKAMRTSHSGQPWRRAAMAWIVALAAACSSDPAASTVDDIAAPDAGLDATPLDIVDPNGDAAAEADGGAATDLGPADAVADVTPTAPPLPVVTEVVPAEGTIGGMVEVEIHGENVGGAVAVFFGESPGLDFFAVDPWTVRATAPPRPAGWVDVTVRTLDAEGNAYDAILPLAFRYVATVGVHKVDPAVGDIAGGTLVTVQGEGFDDQTRFVFGDRLAVAPLILDEHTATMHTPPGVVGRVDVVVTTSESVATLEDGFEFRSAPQLDSVWPGALGLQGGTVRLHGKGLLGAGGVVSIYQGASVALAKIVASAPDGSWLDAEMPAVTAAGPRGVRYSRPGATTQRDDALSYVSFADPTTGKPQANAVLAAVPNELPANVSGLVTIHLGGPIAAAKTGALNVRIGSVDVPVLDHDIGAAAEGQPGATIQVEVPAVAGESWDTVLVEVGSLSAWKSGALHRTAAVPVIETVTPGLLLPSGGTKITVTWSPTSADVGKVLGVRVGALWASGVLESGPGTIQAIAPQGSPGPADVSVIFAKAEAHLPGAVQYAGEPSLAALLPSRGAQAGGTLVRLVGTGMDRLDRVFFGQSEAFEIEKVHAGLALVRTPAGEPGTVSVEAWFTAPAGGKAIATLLSAYTYFDPLAGNYGTWGGPIDGALDVTVLRSNLGVAPVENALVVVDQPGKPRRLGTTDARGQVTISELDLNGPLMVSAGAAGYSAASLIAVDSRHVTLRLRQYVSPPPSDGSGGGGGEDEPDPFPDGAIEGVVTNAAKYQTLPLGSCTDTPQVAGNCKGCESDLDCPGALTCETLLDPLSGFSLAPEDAAAAVASGAPRVCAAPCTEDAHCPSGYDCRAAAWAPGEVRYRCMPTVGEAQIRCETSSPSMFGGNPDPGPLAKAKSDGTFRIESRLGDLAVACFFGYVPKDGGPFVRLAMGLRRAISVYPGATTKNVKIALDTPMTRRMTVELQKLPMGPDTIGMERALTGALDLDPEGYIHVSELRTTAVTDRLTLTGQPHFSGEKASIPWTFYGSLAPLSGGSPVAVAIREKLLPTDADRLVRWPAGAAKPSFGEAFAPHVQDAASDGQQTVAVGPGGYVAVWSGAGLTQQQSPTGRDLFAVWLDPLGSGVGFAGGAAGTILVRDPVTGWGPAVSPIPAPMVGQAPDVDRVLAIGGNKPTDVWVLDAGNRIWRGGTAGFAKVNAPLGVPAPDDWSWPPKPTSTRLRDLQVLPDGTVVVVGDSGFVARSAPSAPGAAVVWESLFNARNETLHGVWGTSGEDFWVVGDRGALGRFIKGAVTWANAGTEEALFAVAGGPDGVHAVGGGGIWVRVGLDGAVQTTQPEDVALDLRAVAPAIALGQGDGWLALGQPILRMGPYLELPYFTAPLWGDALGKVVEWSTAGGQTPTLNMLRIASYDYTTRWEIFLRGAVQKVDLPDFQALGGFNPVPPGKLRLRLWRIYAPGLEIDHFNHKELSVWKWVSYAFNTILVNLPQSVGPMPDGLPPAAIPATPSPAPPGLPDAP